MARLENARAHYSDRRRRRCRGRDSDAGATRTEPFYPDRIRPFPRDGGLADVDVRPGARYGLPGHVFSATVGFATISMSTRAFRVGLTGGIASGKSTASKFFGALGVPIIDTDQLARDVVEPGQPPLERLGGR